MIDFDADQWRAMHSFCVKSILRSSGVMRMDRRSDPTPHRDEISQTIWSLLGFVVMSIFVAIGVSKLTFPVGEFLTISFLSLLVYGGVSGQCATFLFAKNELHVFGALPISASTHLASKVSGSIAYHWFVCAGITGPALLVILFNRGLIAGISWIASIALCVVFLCFAAICAHSFSVRVTTSTNFRYVRSIVWFVFNVLIFVLCAAFLLSDFEFGEIGNSWNLTENPLFLLIPPYWFVSLLLFFDGQVNSTIFTGTFLAVVSSGSIPFYIFKRFDAALLTKLVDAASPSDAPIETRSTNVLSRSSRIGSLGYERAAMWKLAFSHLRYDSTFRSVLTIYFSMFFVWTIILIGNERATELLSDPFASSDPAWPITWVNCVIFMWVFALFEALRTSSSAPATWVLFVTPSNLTRYTAMVVDWIFVAIVLPILFLVFAASSLFWQSPINALLHTITLGWLAYLAINTKSIVNPAMPFTRHAAVSRSNPRFCLNLVLSAVGGIFVYHALASWIYTSYTTYCVSIVLGIGACVSVRYLARRTYDRKFLKADLAT